MLEYNLWFKRHVICPFSFDQSDFGTAWYVPYLEMVSVNLKLAISVYGTSMKTDKKRERMDCGRWF